MLNGFNKAHFSCETKSTKLALPYLDSSSAFTLIKLTSYDNEGIDIIRARKQLNVGTFSSKVWSQPQQCLAVDHYKVGVTSERGHEYILSAVFVVSGFKSFFPAKSTGGSEAMELLFKGLFHIFDPPEVILSDNHGAFVSHLAQAMCSVLKIGRIYTGRRAPWMNGAVETAQRILPIAFKELKRPEDWDLALPFIGRAENTLTGYLGVSPHSVMFGFDPVTAMDRVLMERPLPIPAGTVDPFSFLPTLRDARVVINAYVVDRRELESKRWTEAKNAERKVGVLARKIGDNVSFLMPKTPTNFADQYRACIITGKVGSNLFDLRDRISGKVYPRCASSHMFSYKPLGDPVRSLDKSGAFDYPTMDVDPELPDAKSLPPPVVPVDSTLAVGEIIALMPLCRNPRRSILR